jgi:hypothetical protein
MHITNSTPARSLGWLLVGLLFCGQASQASDCKRINTTLQGTLFSAPQVPVVCARTAPSEAASSKAPSWRCTRKQLRAPGFSHTRRSYCLTRRTPSSLPGVESCT